MRFIVTAKRGNCWSRCTAHRDRPRLFQGTLERTQRKLFTRTQLWITLDRPENVNTILNGHTRLLPGGSVKTLVVTAQGIRPGD